MQPNKVYSPFRLICDNERALSSNFTSEDYLRYDNNLNIMYRRIYGKREVIMIPVEIDYQVHSHRLNVATGGETIELTSEETEILRTLSVDAYEKFPDCWIIMDATNPIYYSSAALPVWWMNNILPYIVEGDEFISDGYVYMRMPERIPTPAPPIIMKERDFEANLGYEEWCEIMNSRKHNHYTGLLMQDEIDAYRNRKARNIEETMGITNVSDRLGGKYSQTVEETVTEEYMRLLNLMVKLYNEGYLNLEEGSKEKIALFTKNWNLMESPVYKGLYFPIWRNTLLTTNPASYIYTKFMSKDSEKSNYEDAAKDTYYSYARPLEN